MKQQNILPVKECIMEHISSDKELTKVQQIQLETVKDFLESKGIIEQIKDNGELKFTTEDAKLDYYSMVQTMQNIHDQIKGEHIDNKILKWISASFNSFVLPQVVTMVPRIVGNFYKAYTECMTDVSKSAVQTNIEYLSDAYLLFDKTYNPHRIEYPKTWLDKHKIMGYTAFATMVLIKDTIDSTIVLGTRNASIKLMKLENNKNLFISLLGKFGDRIHAITQGYLSNTKTVDPTTVATVKVSDYIRSGQYDMPVIADMAARELYTTNAFTMGNPDSITKWGRRDNMTAKLKGSDDTFFSMTQIQREYMYAALCLGTYPDSYNEIRYHAVDPDDIKAYVDELYIMFGQDPDKKYDYSPVEEYLETKFMQIHTAAYNSVNAKRSMLNMDPVTAKDTFYTSWHNNVLIKNFQNTDRSILQRVNDYDVREVLYHLNEVDEDLHDNVPLIVNLHDNYYMKMNKNSAVVFKIDPMSKEDYGKILCLPENHFDLPGGLGMKDSLKYAMLTKTGIELSCSDKKADIIAAFDVLGYDVTNADKYIISPFNHEVMMPCDYKDEFIKAFNKFKEDNSCIVRNSDHDRTFSDIQKISQVTKTDSYNELSQNLKLPVSIEENINVLASKNIMNKDTLGIMSTMDAVSSIGEHIEHLNKYLDQEETNINELKEEIDLTIEEMNREA